jgi:hypothetical protein
VGGVLVKNKNAAISPQMSAGRRWRWLGLGLWWGWEWGAACVCCESKGVLDCKIASNERVQGSDIDRCGKDRQDCEDDPEPRRDKRWRVSSTPCAPGGKIYVGFARVGCSTHVSRQYCRHLVGVLI